MTSKLANQTASKQISNNSKDFPDKSGNCSKPSAWPFPPPGGPTGPLKVTRYKKAVVQTQDFDQAPF